MTKKLFKIPESSILETETDERAAKLKTSSIFSKPNNIRTRGKPSGDAKKAAGSSGLLKRLIESNPSSQSLLSQLELTGTRKSKKGKQL